MLLPQHTWGSLEIFKAHGLKLIFLFIFLTVLKIIFKR